MKKMQIIYALGVSHLPACRQVADCAPSVVIMYEAVYE